MEVVILEKGKLVVAVGIDDLDVHRYCVSRHQDLQNTVYLLGNLNFEKIANYIETGYDVYIRGSIFKDTRTQIIECLKDWIVDPVVECRLLLAPYELCVANLMQYGLSENSAKLNIDSNLEEFEPVQAVEGWDKIEIVDRFDPKLWMQVYGDDFTDLIDYRDDLHSNFSEYITYIINALNYLEFDDKKADLMTFVSKLMDTDENFHISAYRSLITSRCLNKSAEFGLAAANLIYWARLPEDDMDFNQCVFKLYLSGYFNDVDVLARARERWINGRKN